MAEQVARAPIVPWWRIAVRIMRRATVSFSEDRCTHMAAAISYFVLFALFPLTLLTVSIFGIVLRDADVQARVLDAIVGALPVEDSSVADQLRSVASSSPTIALVSLVGTLLTAGTVTAAVRRSVSVAFDADRPRALLHGKLVDYSLFPVIGLLFVSSFALTAAWRVAQAQTQADERFAMITGQVPWLWDAGALAIPASLSFLTFLFLYWLLPNQQIRLRHVWPGAVVAALGVEATKYGFGIYVANFGNYDAVYGSLGGVIVLLLWVYLNANILLFGAEVAAEVPHVLQEEPRHGHATTAGPEVGWRTSLLSMLRGLVMAPGEQSGPATPAHVEGDKGEED